MSYTKNILVTEANEGDNYTEKVNVVNGVIVEGIKTVGASPKVAADGKTVEWLTGAGDGDMVAATYDPAGGERQVAFADELNDGDVIGPATNTDEYLPQWNGANSNTLKNGLPVGTGANTVLKLDANGKIPAIDGSLLTALPNLIDQGAHVLCGFENRTDSTIDMTTGTFTISPAVTNFTVWINGVEFSKTEETLDTFEDRKLTFIYYNQSGALTKSTTAWDLGAGLIAPIALVYRDGTDYALTDERHGYKRNIIWHNWAHTNIGAFFNSGFVGTFGNASLSITQGIFYDEDIRLDTGGTKTSCTLWYRDGGTSMRMVRGSTKPYAETGSDLAYDDGSGTLAAIGANQYGVSWIYGTGDSTEPVYCVVGQAAYGTLAAAQNATLPNINLSTAEWKLCYKVIYRNTATISYIETADFREVQTGVPTTPAPGNDHQALINRDTLGAHPIGAITPTDSVAGQYARSDGTDLGMVDAGNLLSNTIDADADIVVGHFAKGLLIANKGTALTLTIQAQADETYLADSLITIANRGAGTLTIQADTGVTINGESGGSIDLEQYKGGALIRISSDEWIFPNYTAVGAGS